MPTKRKPAVDVLDPCSIKMGFSKLNQQNILPYVNLCSSRRHTYVETINVKFSAAKGLFFDHSKRLKHNSMGECNTILSAYTKYRHLGQCCTHPSNCHFMFEMKQVFF